MEPHVCDASVLLARSLQTGPRFILNHSGVLRKDMLTVTDSDLHCRSSSSFEIDLPCQFCKWFLK